jgi:hypothetical protein
MSAVVMCVLNPCLTPVRAGLILLAILLLGLIVARITAAPDPGELRRGTISESSGRAGTGVKGLRGSLP